MAAITALGGLLLLPVAATSQPAPTDPARDRSLELPVGATVRLELAPKDEVIWLGESLTYTATAVVTVSPNRTAYNPDRRRFSVDVTGLTRFTVTRGELPSGSCTGPTCTPDSAGQHTVDGIVPKWRGRLLEGTTTLRARPPVERLRLEPDDQTIQAGDTLPYRATGLTSDGERLRDVTRETQFTATPRDRPLLACPNAVCAPTATGDYTVTGTLREEGREAVTGTAKLTVVPGEPTTLKLHPDSATVQAGVEQDFTAIGRDAYDNEQVLTERTAFKIVRIRPPPPVSGSCARAGDMVRCKAARPGLYQVTGSLRDPSLSATAILTVQSPVIEPSVQLDPGSGPPNTEVVAKGTTGSCKRVGILSLERAAVPPTQVRGDFKTRFAIPPGTSPGPRKLWLDVICGNKAKRVSANFEVTNQPPQPADDSHAVLQDHGDSIPVTRNDKDPDDPDGYPAALEPGAPAHGTAEYVEDKEGKKVRYTPNPGFRETDRFQYRLCDVVDAAGTKQCGTATVTVTVNPPEPNPVDDPHESTRRDEPVPIDVMGNDDHPDASRLRLLRPARPGATAEKLADGRVRYTPEPGYVGRDTFRYDYCGSAVNTAGRAAACPTATVTVTVEAPGDSERDPQPADDPNKETRRDQPLAIDVMGNDRHPNRARLRVKDRPAHGKAEKLADGTIRYTPGKGFTGTVRFTYDYCADAPGVTRLAACPSATVTVTVTSDPVITSVRPSAVSPGKPVAIAGSTGSCNRAGTLTLEETQAAVHVTADQRGNFTANLTVPKATAPRTYTLRLGVACQGQSQRAERSVTVTNRAPEAADDVDTTTRGHAVEVAVTGNDRDPDDPDGYPTRLLADPAINGRTEARSETIVYTPAPGFIGQDQFRYSLCDDILNAAGRADCGTATVTVTVSDSGRCLAADASSIRVEPGKGPGGAKLGITAAVDRKLADCPFRLLLGEAPLDPPVRAGEDGGITAQRAVPDDARPGTIPVRLATMRGVELAQAPFEIVPPFRWLRHPLVRVLLGAAALITGALAQAAFRRWRQRPGAATGEAGAPEDVRVEPHARPLEVTTDRVADDTRTVSVRLEPHHDPGTQWLQEVDS